MIVTDSVADLLTRIRNSNSAGHDTVNIPTSKLNNEILRILQSEGFIKGFEPLADSKHPMTKVALKYGPRKEKIITNLKRISKPGLRIYRGSAEMPRVLRGLGIAIVTTPRGVMTDSDARRRKVGGEVLCYVW